MRKVITITRNCIISIIILFVSLAANVFSTVVNGSLDAFFSHISNFINLHSLAFYTVAFLLFMIWSVLGWICNCDINLEIQQQANKIEDTQNVFFNEANNKLTSLEKESSTQTLNITITKANFCVKRKCLHTETEAAIIHAERLLDKSTDKYHLANKELYSIVSDTYLEQNNPIDILIEEYKNIEP